MNDTLEVRDDLMRLRNEQLTKLVELSRDKKQAEAAVSKFHSYERAMAAVAPMTSTKYGKHKSAIMAILDYLDEIDRPAKTEEIENALCEGGFRGGGEARTNIRRSISSFVYGLGRKTKQIKMVHDMVGRGSWENARFKK